jgi:hypothetical protein
METKIQVLEKTGWVKKVLNNETGKKETFYKVFSCPTGQNVECQEYWMRKPELTLEWWQKQVGGHIETLPAYDMELPDRSLLAVFNEEGRIQELPRNYLIGEWLEHESEEYYGPALVTTWKAFA